MLEEDLQKFWDAEKFATSWIISSGYLEDTLARIKSFAAKIMDAGQLPIDNNPDFFICKKEDTKSITISQVRSLQDFLSTTPAVSSYKFGIIMEADLMNNNSQNCCLKILEEPPRNTFLFLLSSEPSNLKATIKSRCHKLYLKDESRGQAPASYNEFIDKISNLNSSQKINYLKGIALKAKESEWEEFCNNSVHLMSSLNKHILDSNYKISNEEALYLESRRFIKKDIESRLEKVQKLVKDEKDFDLDKKHMGILILECLG